MLFGYDRETWRTIIVLAVATIAVGAGAGVVAYYAQERPEEAVCLDLQQRPSEMADVAHAVARDLDVRGLTYEGAAEVVAAEIDQVCDRTGVFHHPVNSDLRGTVRQRLEALGRER